MPLSPVVLSPASVSKTLSPGLRVGWCAGDRYHSEIARMKSILNQNTAMAPQLTVAAFLANGGYDRHLRHLRRTYHEQMLRMKQAVRDYFPAETCATRPTGDHVLWLEMPKGFDSMRLYKEALEVGIAIAPGVYVFGFGPVLQQLLPAQYSGALVRESGAGDANPGPVGQKAAGQTAFEQRRVNHPSIYCHNNRQLMALCGVEGRSLSRSRDR